MCIRDRSRLNCRKYFFSHRSVGEWNQLPQEVIDAPSVNAFKNRLDHFWTDVSTSSFASQLTAQQVISVDAIPAQQLYNAGSRVNTTYLHRIESSTSSTAKLRWPEDGTDRPLAEICSSSMSSQIRHQNY